MNLGVVGDFRKRVWALKAAFLKAYEIGLDNDEVTCSDTDEDEDSDETNESGASGDSKVSAPEKNHSQSQSDTMAEARKMIEWNLKDVPYEGNLQNIVAPVAPALNQDVSQDSCDKYFKHVVYYFSIGVTYGTLGLLPLRNPKYMEFNISFFKNVRKKYNILLQHFKLGVFELVLLSTLSGLKKLTADEFQDFVNCFLKDKELTERLRQMTIAEDFQREIGDVVCTDL
ncbi:uncharacterized protein EV154DRAFT_572303 [Mucor mucedo]|uniref:uncharacterized protein n=1 Tax=Mucor mucedo TaxID=29922 RepID=UPI00221F043D|nr:uncharacterized protein EV154DRAFT_572303 [Mucor mucedo]KAI7865044.1 hypothetical protein EV154DRAFT_572303 [Mucor mucedo]